jgi:hypothetical protein
MRLLGMVLVVTGLLSVSLVTAHATTYDWSLSGDGLTGSGTITLSNTASTTTNDPQGGTYYSYVAENITGSITGGANMGSITGITTGDQANNLVTPNAPVDILYEGHVVDNFGLDIAFTDGIYNLAADAGVDSKYVLAAIDNTPAASYSPVTFALTPEVSSTPLPAALPLFAGGLVMLGFIAGRKKRKVASLAAA